jgi:dihydroxyacid dehydratase/phosphogluconate dehydratase
MADPISRLRNGDPIKLDVPKRQLLNVLLEPNEFASRSPHLLTPNGCPTDIAGCISIMPPRRANDATLTV